MGPRQFNLFTFTKRMFSFRILEETLEPGSELEFELDELEPSSEDETVLMPEEETAEVSEDETVMLADFESGEELASDFSADGDEVATKLDLARAYIDMGDAEGAKEILGEVSEEGNDEQKQEAETLLQSI